jgi:hypothetical protein
VGFTLEGDRYSSIGKTRFLPEIELNDAPIKSWLSHSLGMEIFNTKIGLSIVTVIGSLPCAMNSRITGRRVLDMIGSI